MNPTRRSKEDSSHGRSSAAHSQWDITKSRGSSLTRRRRRKQPWFLEALEDRLLLSGSPTIYTVNSTGNGTTGTGDSGTLPYVIGQANANTNKAGSEIQFDPTVFKTAQTITLASTLVLSETAGPEVIDGPGMSSLRSAATMPSRCFRPPPASRRRCRA